MLHHDDSISWTQDPQPELKSHMEVVPFLFSPLCCPSSPCSSSPQVCSQLTRVGWRTKLTRVAPCTPQRAAAGCPGDPNSNLCAAGDPPISSILGVQEAVPNTGICTKTAVGEQSPSSRLVCTGGKNGTTASKSRERDKTPVLSQCPHSQLPVLSVLYCLCSS